MYDHLSDIDNYIKVTGILQEINYYNGNDKIFWNESTDFSPTTNITLYVSLQFDKDQYLNFCGCSGMGDDFDYTTNYNSFEIIPSNTNEIIENLFIETISYGDTITIATSNFIYMDTNFFMIIELMHDETVYLPVDYGLSNLVSYMKENRSIF